MAAQQGLQRRAGEMALRRQTQLDDAATLREQQLADAATLREQKLTDAATLRSQQLADQKTAQANRLDLLKTELAERDKIEDQNAKEERDRLFTEKKDEVAASIDFLDKNGIATGYTITDVNTMSRGRLSVAAREINREVEAFNLRKKDQGQLSDELGALARKPENYEVFKEILDLQDTDSKVIDASSFKEFSKATLIDMLSEARDKIKIRKFGPNMIPEYKSLKKMQYSLMEDTGLLDDITNPTGAGSVLGQQGAEEAAKAIANDPEFQIAISAAGMSDNDMRAVINNLTLGKLVEAAQMLDDEGDLGNTPLLDAYTRWATTSKTAAAVRVQDKLFRAQGASSRLRAINDQLRGMVQRHPWLEQAVDTTDIFSSEEFDRIANRQGQRGVAPTDPPVVEPAVTEEEVANELGIGAGAVEPIADTPQPAVDYTQSSMYDTGRANVQSRGLNPDTGLGAKIVRDRLTQSVKRLTHTEPTIIGGPSMPEELVEYLQKNLPNKPLPTSRSGRGAPWRRQSNLTPEQLATLIDLVDRGAVPPPPPSLNLDQVRDALAPSFQRFNPTVNPLMETDPKSGFRITR